MSRIAIVKARAPQDVEWTLPRWTELGLTVAGLKQLRARLQANANQPFMPQLILPYLAALGQRYNAEHGTNHRFVLLDDHPRNLRLESYDMAWFTATTPTIREVYRLSERARSLGVTTVIGGVHATMLPEEAARYADAVVVGEAEPVVAQLLGDWDRMGRLQPIYHGGRNASLDALPIPRWLDAEFVDYCPWVVPVQTSRGCRNACRFCSTTGIQGAMRRHRPIKDIVAELRGLQEQGVLTAEKVVFFTDNNIVSDTDHRNGTRDTRYARALFEALLELKILWTGQGEISVADDPALVELMARSGCITLLVGFESVQQENLVQLGKPCNQVETYARQIELLHRYGIALIGCFICGLDHDRPDLFAETAAFIERHIDVPQVTLLTPFPGTALYRQLKRQGRLLHADWSRYDQIHVVFRPQGMSARELQHGYDWLVRRLFSYPAIFRRALRAIARPTVYANPGLTVGGRFSSVLAPNLVYRQLAGVKRGRAWEPLEVTAEERSPWVPALQPPQRADRHLEAFR